MRNENNGKQSMRNENIIWTFGSPSAAKGAQSWFDISKGSNVANGNGSDQIAGSKSGLCAETSNGNVMTICAIGKKT